MKTIISIFIFVLGSFQLQAQRDYQEQARTMGIDNIEKFKSFLALPNDAAQKGQINANIDWATQELIALDFEVKTLSTSHLPLLLANKIIKKNLPTVAFYLHLDGQAVDLSKWNQDDPYSAELMQKTNQGFESIGWENITNADNEDLRIFARSSADDKGPFAMFLIALEYLKNNNKNPAFNIKLIIDFEEEQSSPGLPQAVKKYKEELLADVLLILDGPMHSSGLPTLVFGNRGIATLTLTTYGPLTSQHSGHYGNYLPNPALALSKVLGSMKDDKGRVLIPGFYSDIFLSDTVKGILEGVPSEEASIKARTQTKLNDLVGSTYQESLQYPSLNIRGMQSGWVGKEARTIIPSSATAEMDIRLVLESKPEILISSIKNHIEGLGYTVLDHTPTSDERLQYDKIIQMKAKVHYPAFRTDSKAKEGQWLTKILNDYYQKSPVIIRTSGGSVPISPFVSQLGVPAIGVPTVNLDNNQHSPNENLRLGNYFMGIESFIAILTSSF